MAKSCKNCTNCCSTDQEEKFEATLMASDIRDMKKLGGKLEGYWKVTIQVPSRSDPFKEPKLWLDLINDLTNFCGVKITALKFQLGVNAVGYQFQMKED